MISRKVGGLEPFSAGLAVGGGMVLSALWSGREVHLPLGHRHFTDSTQQLARTHFQWTDNFCDRIF